MPIADDRLEVLQVRKLIQCVRLQDSAQIAKLVKLGISDLVNYQDPSTGESPLHVAVSLNHEATVTQLLELGASLGVQDLRGRTPVMTACHYGHLQALECLATRGINAAVMDKAGKSVLFHCLHPTIRHAKCLSFLLESGADPNTKDGAGLPLLCAVCGEGLDRLLEKLLDKGADPNARESGEGRPALVVAAEGGHVECVKLLLTAAGVDKNAAYGPTNLCALHRAASLGHFEVIQALSAYGADFTVATTTGENGVHFATRTSRLLCIRLLGQRGCPANEANEEGQTPQKIAKTEGLKDVMKEVKKLCGFQDKVARGAKPKGFAEAWCVKLYDWVQVNRQAVLDLLKDQDPDKKGTMATDVFTSTLQSISVPLLSDELSKLLAIYDKKGEGVINYDDFLTEQKYIHAQYKLHPGDDIKGKKGKGKKGKKGGKKGKKGGKTKILFPIYFEQERPPTAGVPEGIIEREQYMTDVQRFPRDEELPHSYIDDSPWYLIQPERQYMQQYEAIRHGDMESLQTALATGMPVDCRDKYNKTPLMIACSHGRPDIARFFLERGADVNAIDNFQWTPLHHACHAGEESLVKLLLDAGANIDAQSVNGGTPLMRAIETSQKTIIKLLLERGAKVTLENKHGDTALEVAKNWGDDFIYAIVYAKVSSLPPSLEKKGGKEKGKGKEPAKGGGKGKKKKKGGKEDSLPSIIPGPPLSPLPPPPRLPTPAECLEQARRRCSLGSMQASTVVRPSPGYKPRPAWVSRPPSTRAHTDLQNRAREDRGIESTDFEETRTPFQLQILARVQALEVSDA